MPLKHDRRRPTPEWLERLDPRDLENSAFPLNDALQNSLYYPSAGIKDGAPVKYLGGYIHSFFFVDYGKTEREVDDEIRWPGFQGYSLVGRKNLTERDLAPNNWRPSVPARFRDQLRRLKYIFDRDVVGSPFATWCIFDRVGNKDEHHGPQRFSFVYMCADGVAAYQALYWQNHTAPEVLAIIRPGHAFGGNYTDFTDPDGFFAWTVLGGNIPTIPEYLVCEERDRDDRRACWPGAYPEYVQRIPDDRLIGIWQREHAGHR